MLLSIVMLVGLSVFDSENNNLNYETEIGKFKFDKIQKIRSNLVISDLHFSAEERDSVLISATKVIRVKNKLSEEDLKSINNCFTLFISEKDKAVEIKDEVNWSAFKPFRDRLLSYGIKITVKYPSNVSILTKTDNGDIYMTGKESGSIDITSHNGDVHIENLYSEKLTLQLSDGDVHLDNFNGGFKINIDDGDAFFIGSKLSKNSSIDVKNGDIKIDASDLSNMLVKPFSRNGEIIVNDRKRNLMRADNNESFSFGNPKSILSLQAQNGDITIVKIKLEWI